MTGTARRARRPLAVGWTPVGARVEELAAALDGDSYVSYIWPLSRRPLAPVRYAVSGVLTAVEVVRRRPTAIVATNPPLIPALIAYIYCAAGRHPLILDSHPASFGLRRSLSGRLLLPLHRWLAPRARLNLVASPAIAGLVEGWGGKAVIFHEPPPLTRPRPRERSGRLRVLVPFTIAPDEPLELIMLAASRLPDVDFEITGHSYRVPAWARRMALSNVLFTGFLRGMAYLEATERADVFLSLTTDEFSVPRSAWEAVYASRVLVTSGCPLLRQVFPTAHHVEHSADSVVRAISALRDAAHLSPTIASPAGLSALREAAGLTA